MSSKKYSKQPYSYIKLNNEAKRSLSSVNQRKAEDEKSKADKEKPKTKAEETTDKALTRTKKNSDNNISVINLKERETKRENKPSNNLDFLEDSILLNEENNILIENYLSKIGIHEKVDFNNNLNRLKIYKKILEECSNVNSNCNSDNYKLIDLSTKLLQSHEENSKLMIKVKELESKQSQFEKLISELQSENQNLKKRLDTLDEGLVRSTSKQINSNNQNNININFNVSNDNTIQKLTEENAKLKKFQNQVFEISKDSDDLYSSVIDSMKNVNIIIEQFNLGSKNDALKKNIEQYLSIFPSIIIKLEKSIDSKAKEYNYLLTSKEEQIKMLSTEVFISKQEKNKLKELELEISYLKNKFKANENIPALGNSHSNTNFVHNNLSNNGDIKVSTKQITNTNIFKRK